MSLIVRVQFECNSANKQVVQKRESITRGSDFYSMVDGSIDEF